jgi:hypothetical protein
MKNLHKGDKKLIMKSGRSWLWCRIHKTKQMQNLHKGGRTAKLAKNEMMRGCRKWNDVKSYITLNYLTISRYIYSKNKKRNMKKKTVIQVLIENSTSQEIYRKKSNSIKKQD